MTQTSMAVTKTLESILHNYRSTIISEMLQAIGKEPNKLKQDNVIQLSEYFASPEHQEKVIPMLNEHEKYVLAYFRENHGRVSLRRLQHRLALALPDQFSWLDTRQQHPKTTPNYSKKRGKSKPSLHDVLAGLAQKGVVFSENPITSNNSQKSVIDWSPGSPLFLSPAFKPYLTQIDLPDLPSHTAVEPKFVRQGSPSSFIRNLIRFARFVERAKALSLTTQGILYKNDLRELGNELSFDVDTGSGKRETDNGLLFFLRRMLREVDLVKQNGYDFSGDLTPNPNSDFRQLSLPEQVERCFNAWYKGKMWHELAQLRLYSSGVNQTNPARQEFVDVRTAVLEYLPQHGQGWQILDNLVEDMREEKYKFLFSQRSFTGSYDWRTRAYTTETPYSGRNEYTASFKDIKDEEAGWGKVEADLINHIIAGPLYWLGLVDLGYPNDPGQDPKGHKPILAYRLTEYGQWLLNQGPKPENKQTSEGTIIIQPNFEITVMGNMGDETLMTLDLFCQVLKEQEYTSTFKMTRDTVYGAQKLGWSIERILTYLEEVSHKPVPQNVRRSLEEWGALHERITIRRHLQLIDTAEEKVADEIASNPAFANWRRVTPTTFLTDASPQKILQALDEARWLPLRTKAGDSTAANSIVITDEGEITFTQPTPSIYAQGLLQGLSAETDHGRVLTPALVKTAVNNISLDKVIAQLQQLHRGPLPQKLVIRLKSWCGYYGPASLQTLTLVEFSATAVRDELLVDPELGEYLSQFEAHGRALAIVHPDHIQTVRTILKQRNITINEQ